MKFSDASAGFSHRPNLNPDVVDKLCNWCERNVVPDSSTDFASVVQQVEGLLNGLRDTLVCKLAASDFQRRRAAGEAPSVEVYRPCVAPSMLAWLEQRIAAGSVPKVVPTDSGAMSTDDIDFNRSDITQPFESDASRTPIVEMTPLPDEPPRSIGPYELVRELGHGGMGIVYEATRADLGYRVALKLMKSALSSGDATARFEHERKMLAKLEHPNVARLLDGGVTADHSPYFVMEFIRGARLDQWCDARESTLRDRVGLVAQLCDAVAAAHAAGIIHRDIKPANVLVTEIGVVKVLDFGLAKSLTDDPAFTATGQVLGTPSYMSPEQTGGRGAEIGPATDVYGIGATLYRLLTGRPPFVGELLQIIEQVQNVEPLAPRRLNPNVTRDLDTICQKCLEKQSAKRYGTVAELAADLRRFLEGRPIAARRTAAPERVWKWCKRRPWAAATVVAALAAGVALVAFNFELRQKQSELREKSDALNQTVTKLTAGLAAAESEYEQSKNLFVNFDNMTDVKNSKLKDVVWIRSETLGLFERYFSAAIQEWDKAATQFPADPQFRKGLLDRYLDLGRAYRLNRKMPQMASSWESGLRHAQALASLRNLEPNEAYVVARTGYNVGIYRYEIGQYDAAAEHCRKSLDLIYRALEVPPADKSLDFAWYQVTCENLWARSLIRTGAALDAIPHFDRAMVRAKDGLLVVSKSGKAIAWAYSGQTGDAMTAIDELLRQHPQNDELELHAAEVYAACAASATGPERDKLLDRAMNHILTSVALGAMDDELFAKEIQTLPVFAPLRSRPHFPMPAKVKAP